MLVRAVAAVCASVLAVLLPLPTAGSAEPLLGEAVACPAGRTVRDATRLRTALASAKPGDVIRIADGTDPGEFEISRSGTRRKPISLCGSRDAVLDGEDEAKYVLYVNGADWWRLVGFTVRNGRKGIVVDRSDHDVLRGLLVTGTGDEAIHLRTHSTRNLVVRNTGHRQPKFARGSTSAAPTATGAGTRAASPIGATATRSSGTTSRARPPRASTSRREREAA